MNGKLVEKQDARVSCLIMGSLWDGFWGIRSYGSRVFRLDQHIDRLYETMHTLMIDPCMTKKKCPLRGVNIEGNKIKDGYIRLIVSRGTAIWDLIAQVFWQT